MSELKNFSEFNNPDNEKDIDNNEIKGEVRIPGGKGELAEPPGKNVRIFILIAFIIQVLILTGILYKFSHPVNQNLMLLETPIIKEGYEDPDELTVTFNDLLDTVTLLSAPQFIGRSDENKLRERITFDEGQMMWILIQDQPEPDDDLFRFARISMMDRDYKMFSENVLSDEIVNFFYDLGEEEPSFINNWKELGVKELKASPLLPWKKRIDFVVLSCFDEKHTAGLDYVLRTNPAMPVICPPFSRKTAIEKGGILRRVRNLISLLPGYNRLTSRLGAFVMPWPDSRGKNKGERDYELDLVIHLRDGVAVIAGEGAAEPLMLINEVKKATGRKVLYYIGGTNMCVGIEDPGIIKQLETVRDENPDLQLFPNFNTSLVGHKIFDGVFGERYHKTRLGLRIKIGK